MIGACRVPFFLDKDVPYESVASRVTTILLALFAALALLISASGIAAALGASRESVGRTALTRVLSTLLYATSPTQSLSQPCRCCF